MKLTTLSALALSILCSASAMAQSRPQTRQGFTISFGVGAGSAGVSCSECDSERENAPAGYLRLGGAYRPNLILGGEVNAWTKNIKEDGGEATISVATVNAIAQWYPQPTSGFFVSGGVGVGSLNVEFKVPGLATISDKTTGFGYQVGTGYDIRLGTNFSLTPYATFFGTAGGKVESTKAKLDANVAQIGIGFTWH